MSDDIPTFDPDAFDDHREAHTFAAAVACGVEGCDGLEHDGADTPENWIHDVRRDTLPGSDVRASIIVDSDGFAYAYLSSTTEGPETAATLRAMADAYEAAPAKLRDIADEIDRRNS